MNDPTYSVKVKLSDSQLEKSISIKKCNWNNFQTINKLDCNAKK